MGLFELPREIKVGDCTFTELRMEDKSMYEEYLSKCPFDTNMWSMNFTYVYTFNDSATRKIGWKMISDMLCIFIINNKDKISLLHLPMGECDRKQLNEVVMKCMKMMAKHNEEGEAEIRDISELQRKWIMEKYFKLNKGSFGQEHHYDVKKVASLDGKEFAYIRRKINKFNREYPTAVWRPYVESDYDAMITLQKAWEETAGEKYFRIVDATYYRCALKQHEKLEHKIFVVELHNRIIGMISGAYLYDNQNDQKIGWCFLRKPLNNFDGLSEFLIYKLCCELKETTDILNDGADGAHKGLKFFKERFSPLQSPTVYMLHVIKKKK